MDIIEKISKRIEELEASEDSFRTGQANGMNLVLDMLAKYKEGYDILNEFWDCIPDEEKDATHKKLNELGL